VTSRSCLARRASLPAMRSSHRAKPRRITSQRLHAIGVRLQQVNAGHRRHVEHRAVIGRAPDEADEVRSPRETRRRLEPGATGDPALDAVRPRPALHLLHRAVVRRGAASSREQDGPEGR
jgi:hypothetical protein